MTRVRPAAAQHFHLMLARSLIRIVIVAKKLETVILSLAIALNHVAGRNHHLHASSYSGVWVINSRGITMGGDIQLSSSASQHDTSLHWLLSIIFQIHSQQLQLCGQYHGLPNDNLLGCRTSDSVISSKFHYLACLWRWCCIWVTQQI